MNNRKNTNVHLITLQPELRNKGFADGSHINGPLSEQEKNKMIVRAAKKFGEFLEALGCDWKNDPNSQDTPRRVAKAYVNDLWAGRYNAFPKITTFPNQEYDGIIFEGNIPIVSMCSHHHQTIIGKAHIAYIPKINSKIIGLSKLNRIVEHYSKRGAIQENLTVRIHDTISKIIEDNRGVGVMIEASHNCVQCRGVRHFGTSMKTSKLSGELINSNKTRKEFYDFINNLK
jgi:GTP cyclohydrolase I